MILDLGSGCVPCYWGIDKPLKKLPSQLFLKTPQLSLALVQL